MLQLLHAGALPLNPTGKLPSPDPHCPAFTHRRTQDFTMEGFTWCGPGQGVWGRKSPSEVSGKVPVRPPEAEAKCEINVQFLTFSSIKFWM